MCRTRRRSAPRCSTSSSRARSEEHTSELQSPCKLVCRLLLEKKKKCDSGMQHDQNEPRPEQPARICYLHVVRLLFLHRLSYLPTRFCALLRRSLFFFNDTPTPEIYTLSLHDALPISNANAAAHLPSTNVGRLKCVPTRSPARYRSEEHTSELQSPCNLVCRLLLEKKNKLVQYYFLIVMNAGQQLVILGH